VIEVSEGWEFLRREGWARWRSLWTRGRAGVDRGRGTVVEGIVEGWGLQFFRVGIELFHIHHKEVLTVVRVCVREG
jgi:hypothetical protein